MNEAIYLINTTAQSAPANSTIILPVIARRLGCSLHPTSSGVLTNHMGYYNVTGTMTFTTPTAGLASLAVYQNGVAVPGATVSVTTGDTTSVNTLTVTVPIRVRCGESSTITLVNAGVAANITSASLEVSR